MPRQDFQLNEWIKDLAADGSLTAQQAQALEESLKPVASKIGDSVLRQSEFDRFFNQKKQEFAQKEEALNSFQQTLQAHRNQVDGLYKTAVDGKAEAEARANAYKSRLDYVATTYAVPSEELQIPATFQPPANQPPAQQPSFDSSKFIDRDSYSRDLNIVARTPFYMADVADIEREHRQLFPDKPLTQGQIVKAAMDAKADPKDWWEKQYSISEKRQELEWSRREKELRSKIEAENAQRFSQSSVGILNPNVPVGPVMALRSERVAQPNDPGRRPDPSSRVAAAAAAYAQHRHAPQTQQS